MRVDAARVRVKQHVGRLLGVFLGHAQCDQYVLDGGTHYAAIDPHLDVGRDVELLEHVATSGVCALWCSREYASHVRLQAIDRN